jgi:transposase
MLRNKLTISKKVLLLLHDIRSNKKMQAFMPYLNEAQRRLYAASESKALGRGSKRLIEKELGISHNTINKGIAELDSHASSIPCPQPRQRKAGGGRKRAVTPAVWSVIESFIMPHTRGEPESPLQWVSKSLRKIEAALKLRGISVSHRMIGDALQEHGFSLQSNRKRFEGKTHADRDAQFEYIQKKVEAYALDNQPVISVDAKKRELVGNFDNKGVEWHPSGKAASVNAYDFLTEAEGVAIPYGVYDIQENIGWVNVGITKDTAEFAVQSIRNWWYKMGIYDHNNADSLLICADGGGSNSTKGRLWKHELQKFSNETGLVIEVAHFPPGTSKWNKIEHRLFSYISKNWRGRPLISYQIIVSLIAATTTTKGLKVACEIDDKQYATGIEISDEQLADINICQNEFHGEWNYKILPE